MSFTHICKNSQWNFKGQPAPGPSDQEKVTVLYECKNTQGQNSYRLKEYPGFAFPIINFIKL